MKYIFFGTPKFAVIVLEKLVSAGLAPMAAITNPDRPTGRNQALTPPPVKTSIKNLESRIKGLKIDILQPEELDGAFAQRLESYNADIFVVAAYGKILPKWLIEMPPRGTIGAHPSLLPKYRGATPIQSVILNGDQITGTTIFTLDEKMDRGPVLKNLEFRILNLETYESLSKKLAELSGRLLVEVLPKYIAGEIASHPQDHEAATYTKKFTGQDGCLSPESLRGAKGDEAISIERKIRAFNPEPGVYTINAKGERIKLLEAELAGGKLMIKKIQRAGRKPENIRNSSPFLF